MGTFEAHSAFAQPREGTPEPLVYLLKQSLTETLELAFQTERAHSHAKDESSHELRQVFDHLHGQLASYADDFNKRAVQLGGQALGSTRPPGWKSTFAEHPLVVADGLVHLNELVDSCGEYTARIRKATKKAQHLGNPEAAQYYTGVSHAMDMTLWMLTAHQAV